MPETPNDRIVDEIVKVCRDLKDNTWQGQIKALWKVFNMMAGFIKGQANLIAGMDAKIKQQQTELDRLKSTVGGMLPKKEEKKAIVN
jgi:hypothetical protein